MLTNIRRSLARFISPEKNAMSLPTEYLKYGHAKQVGNFDDVFVKDSDLYTGYGYAAIRNRANAVGAIIDENIRTESTKAMPDDFDHPYLDLIWNSQDFSDWYFWSSISTYLDLEGVYYLMAVRNFDGGTRYGDVQKFRLLNPYDVQRVVNQETLAVGGYIETRYGRQREIPPHMIIEMRELNPFDHDVNYSMIDAAKESQFVLKSASEYTRHALKGNVNAPAIITTDVILPEEKFANFVSRVKSHTKGEPIFGNGPGAIHYESMQSDLSKASLKDVNEGGREALFAASGVSKTLMGIEQSGTTRETANVQKDLFISGHIIPRVRTIIDALNLDYRTKYPDLYAINGATLIIDNPNADDHEAATKKAEAKKAEFAVFKEVKNSGYTSALAAQYVNGEIELEELGDPTEEVITSPLVADNGDIDVKKKDNAITANKFELDEDSEIQDSKGVLKNAIINVEEQIVVTAINRITGRVKNEFESESEVITKAEKKEFDAELALILAAFYTVTMQSKGQEKMAGRSKEFGIITAFKLDRESQNYIKQLARKVSEGHVDTVVSDILVTAREAALAGKSLPEIVSAIKQKYTKDILTTRAETIARTETNRAFTRAQYEADRQFVDSNNLRQRAYKRWRTRSSNPCAYCESLAAEGEIPFYESFRELGESIDAGDGDSRKSMKVKFESLEAGNAHPNCSCIYELIIREE